MIFNIMDFGAVPDGKTLCTDAFKAAVKKCQEIGGGTVYVPAGRFLTGAIHLVSNTNLYIDAGAVLLFSQNPEDYPIVYSRWEGEECEVYSPCIYAEKAENVSVTGHGTLDGQGESWWKLHKEKQLKYPRPRFIAFQDSERVLIQGVKVINSPSWTISPVRCNNVIIDGISIKNPADSPNTDGIDPDSCRNVRISNCYISVGDDCVAIKSGVEYSKERIPCENITITNCTMLDGHGGVVIGSEMSGCVRNVTISNCVFEGTDRGIRIKSRRGRGGVVEDVRVSNLIMKKVMCPLVMNLYYFCGKGGKTDIVRDKNPHPVDEGTPAFRRIHLSNVTAREAGASAGFFYGLPEMPIEDISFHDVYIHMADDAKPDKPAMMDGIEPMTRKGIYLNNVKNAVFSNVKITNHEGKAFTIENCEDIRITDCTE